jgi:hypothetical protein
MPAKAANLEHALRRSAFVEAVKALHDDIHVLRIKRLSQKSQYARAMGSIRDFASVGRAGHDHTDGGIIPLDVEEHVKAVHARHVKIEKQKTGMKLPQVFKRGGTVRRLSDIESEFTTEKNLADD